MISINVKLLLPFILLSASAIFICGVWWERRTRRSVKLLRVSDVAFENLKSQMESAPFGIVVSTSEGEHIYDNRSARTLLDSTENVDIASGKHIEQFFQNLLKESPTSYQVVSWPSKGMIICWNVSLDNYYLTLLFDLSRFHNGVQSGYHFWSQISHEVKSSLTSILSHTEIIRQPTTSEETLQSSAQIVYEQAWHVSRLVQHVLELTNIRSLVSLERRTFNIVLLVEEVIAEFILQADEMGISLTLDYAPNLPAIFGHYDWLKQVFHNLIHNALKFSRCGASVTVMLSVAPAGVLCEVRDTGPGIPDEHLPYIDQLFYRANRQTQGLGLGLSIVREVLTQHDSKLMVKSESQGKHTGTRFYFTLSAAPSG